MSTAIVRIATGRVVTFIRPGPLPVGWQPPEGCQGVASESLAPGWQYEPPPEPKPVTDTLAGVEVTGTGETITIPARILATADVQVPDPERGVVLRDEAGHDWLVTISNGVVAAVQISASPEVSIEVRRQRLAEARATGGSILRANKAKGKTKLSVSERLDAIEALLGITY